MRQTSAPLFPRLHTLLDAHMLGEQEGGNETYVAGLIDGFSRLGLSELHQLTVLHGPRYRPDVQQRGNVRFHQLEDTSDLKRVFRTIPKLCRSLGTDLVHVTYNASPISSCPIVVTVHDVIFRLYPQYFSPRVRLLLSILLPLTMMKAKRIVTLSQTSKEDIEKFYPFTRSKVHVIPLAPGPIVNAQPNYEEGEKYTGGQDFILSVGTVQPRKNIARLIQAYIAARAQGTISAKLLVVGRAAWQHTDIHRMAIESGYGQDIVFTGYLPDNVLAALYRRCQVFVYPSLYEGFGLPVLEAMACDAPVITSNCSSLPEVAGDAAILIDPYSVSDLRTAIERVADSKELRQSLRERGKRRAKSYSWSETAAMTLEIYERITQS